MHAVYESSLPFCFLPSCMVFDLRHCTVFIYLSFYKTTELFVNLSLKKRLMRYLFPGNKFKPA